MSRSMLWATLILVLAARAQPEHAPTGPLPKVGPPLLLRLEGVIAGSRRAAERKGFTAVSFAFTGSDARRWLGVTDARTVGGDQPLDGKAVLEMVAPFTPNFLVAGFDDLVGRLRDGTYQLRCVEAGENQRPG